MLSARELAIASVAMAAAGAFSASAQTHSTGSGQAYPTKPIRIVVNFAPGGGTDIVARAMGAEFTKSLGQLVIVENRAGANGNIGADAVAKAAPDGHTLLMSTNAAIVINPHLYKKLPFDPLTDFAPVSQVATLPFVLALPNVPALSELPALKGAESDLWYGLLAPANTDRKITELLAKETARVLALQEFRNRWEPTGTVLVGSTPDAFAKVIRNDYERWKKVVQAAGTKAE